MPYCSNCGVELPDGARHCPNCGMAVPRMMQIRQNADAPQSEELTEDAVRRGMTNARYNEKMSGIFAGELLIIAIVIGVVQRSVLWGVGTFLGLAILSTIPSIGRILCVIFGIAWGVIGYFIGKYFWDDSTAWAIALVAGLFGIAANLASRQYYEDLG